MSSRRDHDPNAEPPGPIPVPDLLCFATYATTHAFMRAYKPLLAPLGLTYPQYLVMLVLWNEGPRTVKEIGDVLHLDSGTLTPLLKRLEAAGRITRSRDLRDERRVVVALTPEGAALREKAVGIPAALGCVMGADRDEINRLRDGLDRLRENLMASIADEAPDG